MSVGSSRLGHMIDKLSQALALVREAFADAQAGAVNVASVDLAAEVDGAQRVINAASAVQAVRVAQYAGREQEQDGSGAWVEVDHGVGYLGQFAATRHLPAGSVSGQTRSRCPAERSFRGCPPA